MKSKLLSILLAASFILTACGQDENATETKEEPSKEVEQTQSVESNKEETKETQEEKKEEVKEEPVNADENSEAVEDLANEKPNITIKNHDLISGGGEKVGTMSVSIAQESQITDDYIKQWFEKVDKMDNSYDILISTESMEGDQAHGVWRMSGGMVFKNVYFEKDENGIYAVSNSGDSEYVDTNK